MSAALPLAALSERLFPLLDCFSPPLLAHLNWQKPLSLPIFGALLKVTLRMMINVFSSRGQ